MPYRLLIDNSPTCLTVFGKDTWPRKREALKAAKTLLGVLPDVEDRLILYYFRRQKVSRLLRRNK